MARLVCRTVPKGSRVGKLVFVNLCAAARQKRKKGACGLESIPGKSVEVSMLQNCTDSTPQGDNVSISVKMNDVDVTPLTQEEIEGILCNDN